MPPQWIKFEELLSKMGNGKPPQSLILGYWFDTSDEEGVLGIFPSKVT